MKKKIKKPKADEFTWERGLARVIKDPTLGPELVREWTAVLAKDGNGISELLLRLLIAAESASNWQRQVAIVEGKLASAERELKKRYDAGGEAWGLYKRRMEQQEEIEFHLRAKVKELTDKLQEARRLYDACREATPGVQ